MQDNMTMYRTTAGRRHDRSAGRTAAAGMHGTARTKGTLHMCASESCAAVIGMPTCKHLPAARMAPRSPAGAARAEAAAAAAPPASSCQGALLQQLLSCDMCTGAIGLPWQPR